MGYWRNQHKAWSWHETLYSACPWTADWNHQRSKYTENSFGEHRWERKFESVGIWFFFYFHSKPTAANDPWINRPLYRFILPIISFIKFETDLIYSLSLWFLQHRFSNSLPIWSIIRRNHLLIFVHLIYQLSHWVDWALFVHMKLPLRFINLSDSGV